MITVNLVEYFRTFPRQEHIHIVHTLYDSSHQTITFVSSPFPKSMLS